MKYLLYSTLLNEFLYPLYIIPYVKQKNLLKRSKARQSHFQLIRFESLYAKRRVQATLLFAKITGFSIIHGAEGYGSYSTGDCRSLTWRRHRQTVGLIRQVIWKNNAYSLNARLKCRS